MWIGKFARFEPPSAKKSNRGTSPQLNRLSAGARESIGANAFNLVFNRSFYPRECPVRFGHSP